MASFPTLSTGAVACYPLVRTVSSETMVHRFENDRQQRYRTRRILQPIELTFEDVSAADWEIVKVFYDSQRGSFGSFDITIAGTLISNLYFADDSLSGTETSHGLVSGSVAIRQSKG